MQVNVIPFIPLVNAPTITLTLTSDPTGLPGNIDPIQEWAIRPRGDATSLRSTGQWAPSGSNSGDTTLAAGWLLNGNYGFTDFVGYVSCCGRDWISKRVLLEVTGMCRGDADAALSAEVAKIRKAWSAAADSARVFAGFALALMGFFIRCAFGHPGFLIGALLSAIAAAIALSRASNLQAYADKLSNDYEKRLHELADPYIKNLPECS